jgi:hypothetical protein
VIMGACGAALGAGASKDGPGSRSGAIAQRDTSRSVYGISRHFGVRSADAHRSRTPL